MRWYQHPPPGHRLLGGPCSGRCFSLCLCQKELAVYLDEEDVRLPVG